MAIDEQEQMSRRFFLIFELISFEDGNIRHIGRSAEVYRTIDDQLTLVKLPSRARLTSEFLDVMEGLNGP